jgi:secreted Zn-dependent insulinase-like peptidase
MIEKISLEIGYQANLADVYYSAKTFENVGIKFKIKGYNHKLNEFISQMMALLKNIATNGFGETFKISVQDSIEKKIKDYSNMNVDIDSHTNNNRLMLTMENTFHADVMAHELKENQQSVQENVLSGAYLANVLSQL